MTNNPRFSRIIGAAGDRLSTRWRVRAAACASVCPSDRGGHEPGQRRAADAAAGGRRDDGQPVADAAAGRHPPHPRR